MENKFNIVKLSEVTSVIFSGITPLSGGEAYTDESSGVAFIRSGNIQPDGNIGGADIFIRPEIHSGIMRNSQVKCNDILIAIVGATIGRVGIFKRDTEANINQAIAVVRLNDKRLLPEYVLNYLQSPSGQVYLDYLKRPVARANINLEEIGSIGIPTLSLDKQQQLVADMSSASQQRAAKLHEADELFAGMDRFLLEQLRIDEIPIKSRLAVAVTLGIIKAEKPIGANYYHPERLAVVRALENNPAVSTRRLVDIVNFMREAVPANNGKPYLGLAGVISNTGELSDVEEEAEGQAFTYEEGDVLYARLRPYLNKVLYAEKSGVCSTEFHVMRVNNVDVLPEYLTAIMRSKIIVAQTKHMMTGNTHPRISNDDVRNLRVPVPSIDIQYIIVKEMRNRLERSRLLKREVEAEWAEAKERFERELIGG